MELLYIIVIILCFFLLFQFVEELQLWVSSHRLWTQKSFRHLSSAVHESETSLSDSLRRWPLTFSCCYSLRCSLQLNVCGGSTCSSPVPKPPPCSPPQPPDLRGGWTDQSGSDLNLSDVSLCLKFLTDWHPDGCECEAESSVQETELWPKLERQLSCSHVFKENSLQFVVSEERSCRHLH